MVILAGYGDRMETFFQSNPGLRSRIAHHLDFPDYGRDELLAIAKLMLRERNYRLGPGAEECLEEYIVRRMARPQFANARSMRNALDRARFRQASRLFDSMSGKRISKDDLMTISVEDIRASRVFEDAGADGSTGE